MNFPGLSLAPDIMCRNNIPRDDTGDQTQLGEKKKT